MAEVASALRSCLHLLNPLPTVFRLLIAAFFWLSCCVCAGAQTLGVATRALQSGAQEGSLGVAELQGQGAQALYLNHRKIVTFRASLQEDAPADRVELAQAALALAMQAPGGGSVTWTLQDGASRFEVNGRTVFFLVQQDIARPRAANLLEAASLDVQQKLQTAVNEAREMVDPRRLAVGAAYSLGATVLGYVLISLVFWLRKRLTMRWTLRLEGALAPSADGRRLTSGLVASYAEHARHGIRFLANGLAWGASLVLVDAWASFVLHQFAYTRPWGERSTAWLLQVLGQFALGMAGAIPGLVIAGLVFVLARFATKALNVFLLRIERGDARHVWLDADTAAPTRRLGSFVIWLFALAMAYPYLPGANSEAFKGVSVLAGLMLSLGASSVVGQALSGLSLMYSRSLRVGEYVKVGETEGTVVALGMFTTKIHTGLGEEVSVPNTVVFGQPIRNFSRLVQDGQFVLATAITIGYATPWRQVHAMLMEAATRTPGVAQEPAPYVVQTALSDFYVEYRLCAQSNKNAPRRRAEALNQLHANILDVFNENGVQIMSPHYMADPSEPQVVPPGGWSAPDAQPLTPPGPNRQP